MTSRDISPRNVGPRNVSTVDRVSQLLRELTPQVLAILLRGSGDFETSEERCAGRHCSLLRCSGPFEVFRPTRWAG